MINKEIEADFYAGNRSDKLPFVVNDSVEILQGDYKGRAAAVISAENVEPETTYLIELGDGSGDLVLPAKWLKKIS